MAKEMPPHSMITPTIESDCAGTKLSPITSAALTVASPASTPRRSKWSASQPIGHCRATLPTTKAESHSAPVSGATPTLTA